MADINIKPEPEDIYCAECGNHDISDMAFVGRFANGDQYICKKCQNMFIVPINDED